MHKHLLKKVVFVAGVVAALSMIASPASAHTTHIAWDCASGQGSVTFYAGTYHSASEGPSPTGGIIVDGTYRGAFTSFVTSLPAGADGTSTYPAPPNLQTATWQVVTVAGLTNGSHTVHTTSNSQVEAPWGNSPLTINIACVWNDAPVVSVTGVTPGATYEHGAVPAAGCLVVDTEDGTSTPSASLSAISGPRAGVGLGSQTAGCSYTDAGGIARNANAIYSIVDTTSPEVIAAADKTVEATGPSGAAVAFVAATATDAVDGPLPATCDRASGSSFPLGATTVTCTATDGASNQGSDTFTVTVQDTTVPSLVLPADITVKTLVSPGSTVTFASSASDIVDGAIATRCSPASGTRFPLGTTTVTCTATDDAGNEVQGTFDVTVSYAWSGLLPPLMRDGSPVFKTGQTIPITFKLTGESATITDATAKLYLRQIIGNMEGPESEAVSTAAGHTGNTFRYDAESAQYVYNLGTKRLAPGTWRLRVDLGDEITRTLLIRLR